MALDISALSNKEAVTAIYVGYFNRAPDPEGLQYWIDELESGSLTLAQVAQSFSEQPETTSLYPFLSTPDVASASAFVTSVYLNLFNRAPDTAGLDYWVGQVLAKQDGADLGQIILSIISGAQGDDITIVNNKIKAGCDFAADLAEAGIIEFDDGDNDAAELAAAKDALAGVDETDASVTAAAAKTDTFVSEATNTAPVATAAAGTTDEDVTLNGTLVGAASDVDGDALTFSLATGAANGVATVNADGTYSYVPGADFNGSDSFTYTVEDGRGGSSTETVTITVDAVNDAPVAAAAAAISGDEDTTISGAVGATDVDGDALTYSVSAAAANGTAVVNADGSYDYTPNANYNGSDSFTISIFDGTATITQVVSVTVNSVNDVPVGDAATAVGFEDNTVSGQLTATDVETATAGLTFALATAPAINEGTVVVNADGSYVFTPVTDFAGETSFTFTVTDADGATSDPQTVTINVVDVADTLTTGIDVIQGSPQRDVILGTEETLNGSDSIDGTDGDDLVFITTEGDASEAGFILANVEEFRVTAEDDTTSGGTEDATFDLSSSDGIELLSNTNSTANVAFTQANMIADADGDGRTEVNLSIFNATNDVDTTLSVRDGDLTGNDEANIRIVSGDASFQDVDNLDIDDDLGHIDLFIEGSVGIRDIDSGNTTMTITQDASSSLEIDDNIPSSINFVDARSTADGGMNGSSTGSAGSIELGFSGSTSGAGVAGNGATFHGGTGADNVHGGDNDDLLMGYLGDDVLDGQDGDDSIEGGMGADNLSGGADSDTLLGGDDNDTIDGGADSDSILGGDGDDQINTGSGAGVETVDGGEGSDSVTTDAAELTGDDPATGAVEVHDDLRGGTDGAGPDAARNDTLNIEGNSADVHGLNNVQQFEHINLNGGAFEYLIGDGSDFMTDHESGTSGPTFIDGGSATGSVEIDASALNTGISLAGSFSNDTLIGGDGDDFISNIGAFANSLAGNDLMEGNDGNDTFIFTSASGLDANDTVDGGDDNDTIVVEVRGTSTMSGNIQNVENFVLAGSLTETTVEAHGFPIGFDLNIGGDFTLNLDATFNSDMNIDASAMDTQGDVFVLNVDDAAVSDLNVTGGDNDDVFNFGGTLTSADVIDGGTNVSNDAGDAGEGDTLSISSNAGGDADFTGVTNVECLVLDASFTGTLTLGAEAFEAGFTKVDASAVAADITIDASGFGGPLEIIDGPGNNTIIGTDFADTIVSGGGDDDISGGAGADVLEVQGGNLNANDTLDGVETVTLMNTSDSSNIKAVINLDNVTGLETVNVEGTGIEAGGNASNNDSVTFQGGNVGTVTEITVDTSARTDDDDTFSVIIDGAENPGGAQADVDADYAFNIIGGAGDVQDQLFKFNQGINNNINWDGGAGEDEVYIFAGDLGASTTINGGDDDDTLIQLENGVAFTDDDFSNVSSMEVIQADSGATAAVMATLGAKADAAGVVSIDGGQGNDDVTVDAAFDNALAVDLNEGGDDTINAGASAATVTISGEEEDFTAADALTGGTGNMDMLVIDFDNDGATADLTNANGFETIHMTESAGSSSTFNMLLGNQTSALEIIETDGSLGSTWDGETLNLDASAYQGAITYTGNNNVGDSADLNMMSGSGADSIDAADGDDTVDAGAGNDTVDGGAGDDQVMGGTGSDSIMGDAGTDVLDGGADNDTIDGGADNDTITGGAGSDSLTGGDGADSFRYVSVSDSAGGVSLRDVITDFDVLLDTICIEESMLQEFAGVTGIQFVGTEEFFSDAQGTVSLAANVGNGLADIVFESGLNKLWIDVDDNGILNGQDVQITLDGVTTGLTAANFKSVDTVAPDAPTILSVTDDSATAGDFITNDGDGVTVTVGFSNATDGTGAAVGDTITLTVPGLAGSPFTSAPLTAVQVAAGQIDFALPTGGTYTGTLSAVVNDTFGITQTSDAATQDLVIDTTLPTITISTVEGDNVINAAEDGDVTISGTTTGVADGQTVSVTINGGAAITTTVTGNAWTLADQDLSGLADGAVTITADVSDVAGNAAVQAVANPTKDATATITITGLGGEITDDDIIDAAEDTAGGFTVTGTVTGVEDGQFVNVEVRDSGNTLVHTFVGVAVAGGAFATGAAPAGVFSADGTYTATASVSDVAGNPATSSFDFEVDENGPVYTIDSIVYDETAGTITINGDFSDVDVTDTIDVSQAIWQDGATGPIGAGHADFVETTALGAATTWFGTDTQLVLTWAPGAQATFEGAATVGGTLEDLLDFGAGTLVDGVGNQSLAANGNEITLHISTAGQGVAALRGFGGDDELTADGATGDSLTGGDGADSFHIDDATFTADGVTISATVTDFDLAEGDTLSFSAADLNALLAGTPYADGDDASEIAFLTFDSSAGVTFEAGVGGVFIFDVDNSQIRFDVDGQTSFNGSAVDALGSADDIVIQLTGVTALTAADIDIIA